MKRAALIILSALAGVAIGHGMFTFYWLSPNPADWTAEGRYLALNVYIVFAGGLAVITAGATHD